MRIMKSIIEAPENSYMVDTSKMSEQEFDEYYERLKNEYTATKDLSDMSPEIKVEIERRKDAKLTFDFQEEDEQRDIKT